MQVLGHLIRQFARSCVRIYYRNLEIDGRENVPSDGPLLICANHPNSLIDPLMVGIAARRPVRFLAKAPLFQIPVLGKLMYAMGMIPAYRGQDDRRQVKKNLETLDAAGRVLAQGDAVGIFPEGLSHDHVGVELVRSGAARMVFQVTQGGMRGLKILPLGLNYEKKEQFRSDVWLRIGEPIEFDNWRSDREGHEKQLQRQFTADLTDRLKQLVIHLENHEWEPWLELVDSLIAGTSFDSPSGSAVQRLHRRDRIAQHMNGFIQDEPEEAARLGAKLQSLRDSVESKDVSIDRFRRMTQAPAAEMRARLWRCLGLLILAPAAIAGTLHHAIPFGVTRFLAKRYHSKVNRTDVSFYRLLLSVPIYLLWYALIGVLLIWMTTPLIAIGWLIVAPMFGLLAFEFWPAAHRWWIDLQQARRFRKRAGEWDQAAALLREIESDLETISQRFESEPAS